MAPKLQNDLLERGKKLLQKLASVCELKTPCKGAFSLVPHPFPTRLLFGSL